MGPGTAGQGPGRPELDETRTGWGLVLAIWFAGLVAAGQFSKTAVIFAELGEVWPGAGLWLGLVVSVVGAVGILFGTSAGLAVARLGARRLLLGALVAGAGLSAVEALLPPLWLMLPLRVAEGFAHLAIVVAGPVLMGRVAAPRDQVAAMTLWSTFFGLAFTLTATLGLPLVQARGPAALFAVHAGLMLLAAAILWRPLPPDPPSPAAPVTAGALWRDHLAIYASPRIAAPATGFVFYTLLYVALLTLVPQLVRPELRALAAGVMPLVSIVSSLGLGVAITRRFGPVRVVQAGFAAAAVAVSGWAAEVALAGDPGLAALVAAFAVAAALGLVQGASFAAIPALNNRPATRAMAAGAIAQLGNVGTTLGTPILLALDRAMGPQSVTVFALPLCAGGFLAHRWQAARRRRISG